MKFTIITTTNSSKSSSSSKKSNQTNVRTLLYPFLRLNKQKFCYVSFIVFIFLSECVFVYIAFSIQGNTLSIFRTTASFCLSSIFVYLEIVVLSFLRSKIELKKKDMAKIDSVYLMFSHF